MPPKDRYVRRFVGNREAGGSGSRALTIDELNTQLPAVSERVSRPEGKLDVAVTRTDPTETPS